jgi:hypothetical protein
MKALFTLFATFFLLPLVGHAENSVIPYTGTLSNNGKPVS